MSNINNSFLQATEIMINQKLSEISYDKTLVCEILSVNKDKAEYVVSDGTTKFTAYADADKNYIVGQKVYVTIPQGNFSMKKIIIGGYDVDDTRAYEYIHPFDKFVDVSGNLAPAGSQTLIVQANGTDQVAAASQFNITDVPNNFGELKYIGLTVTFTTLLEGVSKGNYGIRVYLYHKDKEQIDYFEFDSSELYGNPYYYDSGFTFSKAFNYPLGVVYDKGVIELYQNGNFNLPEEEINTEVKASDIYLCFAYDQADFTEDKFTIAQSDDTKLEYSNNSDPVKINATHIVYNENIKQYEKDEIEPDAPISWYRYRVGTPNVGGGTHWEQLFKLTSDGQSWIEEDNQNKTNLDKAFEIINSKADSRDHIESSSGLKGLGEKEKENDRAIFLLSEKSPLLINDYVIPPTIEGKRIVSVEYVKWAYGAEYAVEYTLLKRLQTDSNVFTHNDKDMVKDTDSSHDFGNEAKQFYYFFINYDSSIDENEKENIGSVEIHPKFMYLSKKYGLEETLLSFTTDKDNVNHYFIKYTKENIISDIEQPIGHPFQNYDKNNIPQKFIGKIGVDQYRITSFPYTSYQNDQIKAILEYEDKKLESNIIKFDYKGAAAGEEAKHTNGAINLKLSDTGYYPVYGQYNELIEDYDNATKTITASFADSRTWKDNAKSIEWRIPKSALIVPEGELTSGENYDIIKIQEKVEGSLPNTLEYKLKKSERYDASRAECLIECYVEVEGQEPEDKASGEVKLHFSRQGSSGTDFTLYLTDDEGNEKDFLYVVDNGTESIPIYLNAHVRDQQGKDIEINTNFIWEWIYKQDKNSGYFQVEQTLDETKQYNERISLVAQNKTPENNVNGSKNYCNAVLKVSYNMPISDGFNVNLERFYPIGFTNINNLSRITGATEVSYNGSGIPFYNKTPYKIFIKENNITEQEAAINSISILKESQHVSMPTLTSNNELMPHSIQGVFTQNPLPWMCLNINTSAGTYVQPVFLWYDVYSSGILGSWDGSLKIDEDRAAVLASLLVAGENTSNKFTGVVIGDVENTSADGSKSNAYGVYGYQEGVKRFSLDENGNFFVGQNDSSGQNFLKFDANGFELKASKNILLGTTDDNGNLTAGIKIDNNGNFQIEGVSLDVSAESIDVNVDNGTHNLIINSSNIGTANNVIAISNDNNNIFKVDGQGNITATTGNIATLYMKNQALYSDNHWGDTTSGYQGSSCGLSAKWWTDGGRSHFLWAGLYRTGMVANYWSNLFNGNDWSSNPGGTGAQSAINDYANFYVTHSGYMKAKAGNIGGWDITPKDLVYRNQSNKAVEAFLSGTASQDTTYTITDDKGTAIASGGGWIIWAKNKFGIDNSGKLWCSSANITGELTAISIATNSGKFSVNTNGVMRCTGATITGTLTVGSTIAQVGMLSNTIVINRSSSLKSTGHGLILKDDTKEKVYIAYVEDTNTLYIGGHSYAAEEDPTSVDMYFTGIAINAFGAISVIKNGQTAKISYA